MSDTMPLPAHIEKALASLEKAWPVLTKHADHIDGEFAHALATVRTCLQQDASARAILGHVRSYCADILDETPVHSEAFVQGERRVARRIMRTLNALQPPVLSPDEAIAADRVRRLLAVMYTTYLPGYHEHVSHVLLGELRALATPPTTTPEADRG